jgi:hypothetical protein
MARRVIKKFALKYIAGVTKPANEHARAVIMKRAPEAHIGENYMSVDFGALADVVLEGAAVALRKREPHLTPEQAYAAVYTSPDYREAAKAERAASAERLAGVPVARTAATILNDLSDESILALVQEIRDENPYVSDAELVRMIASSAEERAGRAAVQENVRRATRDGARVPQPGDTLSSRSSDDGVRKRDAALDAITAKAAELRRADPSLSEAQAFAAAYTARANRDLAKAERSASRAALEG